MDPLETYEGIRRIATGLTYLVYTLGVVVGLIYVGMATMRIPHIHEQYGRHVDSDVPNIIVEFGFGAALIAMNTLSISTMITFAGNQELWTSYNPYESYFDYQPFDTNTPHELAIAATVLAMLRLMGSFALYVALNSGRSLLKQDSNQARRARRKLVIGIPVGVALIFLPFWVSVAAVSFSSLTSLANLLMQAAGMS
ncbi:hypothetical protein [Aliagarivorans taiwanensis]|uniref:hypothetical protein n=1 Tax=Aliagarivorans taiwanensis TaxID=561966 RepID=UPI00047C59D2|nr:hypothetical protein [Aliagarivorans taiwanensis]